MSFVTIDNSGGGAPVHSINPERVVRADYAENPANGRVSLELTFTDGWRLRLADHEAASLYRHLSGLPHFVAGGEGVLVNVNHAQTMSFNPFGPTGGEPELALQTGSGTDAVVLRGAQAERVWEQYKGVTL